MYILFKPNSQSQQINFNLILRTENASQLFVTFKLQSGIPLNFVFPLT